MTDILSTEVKNPLGRSFRNLRVTLNTLIF